MAQPTTDTSTETRAGLMKDIENIFADPEAWLNTPLIELGGRKPVDLIGTADEDLVRGMIAAIIYGQFS